MSFKSVFLVVLGSLVGVNSGGGPISPSVVSFARAFFCVLWGPAALPQVLVRGNFQLLC